MSALMDEHWLVFDPKIPGVPISGCHCGFLASPDDDGWGDSVLRHVAAEAIREATLAWAEVAPDNGQAFNRAEVADVLFRHADSLDGGPIR